MNEDNGLIHDCLREPFDGIGKPDPLNENLSGFCSWLAEAGEITSVPGSSTKGCCRSSQADDDNCSERKPG